MTAAVSTLWELSGADVATYDWHSADVVDAGLARRLATPVVRAYHTLSTATLRELVFAYDPQRLVDGVLASCDIR